MLLRITDWLNYQLPRRMVLTLLISTNKKSACLNRAGCINYLSYSREEVVQYKVRYKV